MTAEPANSTPAVGSPTMRGRRFRRGKQPRGGAGWRSWRVPARATLALPSPTHRSTPGEHTRLLDWGTARRSRDRGSDLASMTSASKRRQCRCGRRAGDTCPDGIEGRRAPLRTYRRCRTGRFLPSTGSRPRLAWAARRGDGRGAVGARDRPCPRPGSRRSLPEEIARSLVRHRVLERIAAELAASGELERLVNAALASPQTLELTDKVLASDQTQRALGHVASSPELRDAIARQTTGLAEEVVAASAPPPPGSTTGPSRSSAARREPSAPSTVGSRRARSRSRPTRG